MPDSGPKKRVIAYVDGFNLYYGLCAANWKRYLWLDVAKLASKLIRPDQELVCTKYFTARIVGGKATDRPSYAAERDAKLARQTRFLEALDTIPNLKIFYGQYLEEQIECKKCHATWMDAEEKMTDVNIATEMIVDSFANRFDVALLISGDSDLVPPVKAIKSCHGHKRINVAFPPKRFSSWLNTTCHGQCIIGRGTLKNSQLPPEVTSLAGQTLTKPTEWI